MKRVFAFAVMTLAWLVLAGLPAAAQQRLYPISKFKDAPVVLSPDHSGIVLEKAFQFKLTLGFPASDSTIFIPQTETPIVMLWLKIQNTSQRAFDIDISKFASVDDQGQMYTALSVDDAFKRIVAGFYGATSGSKTLKALSLGHVADIPSEEEYRSSLARYSFQSGPVGANIQKEGWIYFEKPARKKFTVSVTLNGLSSQALNFSTEKQK